MNSINSSRVLKIIETIINFFVFSYSIIFVGLASIIAFFGSGLRFLWFGHSDAETRASASSGLILLLGAFVIFASLILFIVFCIITSVDCSKLKAKTDKKKICKRISGLYIADICIVALNMIILPVSGLVINNANLDLMLDGMFGLEAALILDGALALSIILAIISFIQVKSGSKKITCE